MLCEDCKKKPVARGIKEIKCCGEKVWINYLHSICKKCSEKQHKCERCGVDI